MQQAQPQSKENAMVEGQKDVAAKAQARIDEQLEKEERILDGKVKKAQMLSTAVPPQSEWKVCWSCGKKAPLLTRDPSDGVLICRTCYAYAQVASTAEDIGDILEAVSSMLTSSGMTEMMPGEDDPEDGNDPDEGEDPGKGEENEVGDEEAKQG